MNGDFHIDFLKKFDVLLTPFGSIWESLWLPLGTFERKMEAKERVRFLSKWGPAPKEPRTPLQTPFWRYSGSILRCFWTLWDIPWNAFGRPFWQVALFSAVFWESEAPSLSETRAATLVS